MNCFLCLPDSKLPSDIYLPARVPVQEMPHLCTIFGREGNFGAGKHSFLHRIGRTPFSGAEKAPFVHHFRPGMTFGAGNAPF